MHDKRRARPSAGVLSGLRSNQCDECERKEDGRDRNDQRLISHPLSFTTTILMETPILPLAGQGVLVLPVGDDSSG